MKVHFSPNLEPQTADIQALFSQFSHPNLQEDLVGLGALKKVEKAGDTLAISLTFPFPFALGIESLKNELTEPLLKLTQCANVKWHINTNIATLKRANGSPAVKGVKNIIAVTSGKDGP